MDFETLQNARRDLIGELDAIIQYDDHLHKTNVEIAKETWVNIRNEELVHVGELLGLLCYLAPYQKQFIEQGLGTKETLVMIRAKDGQMLLNTLFFADEVVKNPAKEVTEKGNAAELKMAQTIIESMTGKFEPEQYKDEYREKVQEAIEKKIAGKEIAAPKEKNFGTVSNLMYD